MVKRIASISESSEGKLNWGVAAAASDGIETATLEGHATADDTRDGHSAASGDATKDDDFNRDEAAMVPPLHLQAAISRPENPKAVKASTTSGAALCGRSGGLRAAVLAVGPGVCAVVDGQGSTCATLKLWGQDRIDKLDTPFTVHLSLLTLTK